MNDITQPTRLAEAELRANLSRSNLGVNTALMFPFEANRADYWAGTVIPPTEDLPEVLRPAADSFRAAMAAWEEVRDKLQAQAQLMQAARKRDAAAVAEAVREGRTLQSGEITKHYDLAHADLAIAHAMHVTINNEALRATANLMAAIEDHRDTLLGEVDGVLDDLQTRLETYERPANVIRKHIANAVAMRHFLDMTDARNLENYRGRPSSALEPLPKPLPEPKRAR